MALTSLLRHKLRILHWKLIVLVAVHVHVMQWMDQTNALKKTGSRWPWQDLVLVAFASVCTILLKWFLMGLLTGRNFQTVLKASSGTNFQN